MKTHSSTPDQRQAVEEPDLLAVGDGALEGLEVREQVLQKKRADGDNAQQRVQLVPEETCALTGA